MAVYLPKGIKTMKLGLGWDTKMDLDASVIMMDKNGNKACESVWYANKNSPGVSHAGDNLTGDGAGDDENITINFDKIPHNVDSLWPVVTIYSRGNQFDDVKGAYARLVDSNTKKEFCKFNLSRNLDNISNGAIVASISRVGNPSQG